MPMIWGFWNLQIPQHLEKNLDTALKDIDTFHSSHSFYSKCWQDLAYFQVCMTSKYHTDLRNKHTRWTDRSTHAIHLLKTNAYVKLSSNVLISLKQYNKMLMDNNKQQDWTWFWYQKCDLDFWGVDLSVLWDTCTFQSTLTSNPDTVIKIQRKYNWMDRQMDRQKAIPSANEN